MKFETLIDDFHKECEAIARIKRRNEMMNLVTGTQVKDGLCPSCNFPLDEAGDCTNFDCETNLVSEHELRDPLDEKDNTPGYEEDDDYSDMFNNENELDDEDEEETND